MFARYFVSGLGLAVLIAASPVSAQVNVVFGTSWDSPANSLQNIVDNRYGAGNIDCPNDYIGKNVGDPDPFGWEDVEFDALLVREVAGYANNNILGWYKDAGVMPVIDGIDDGVVFNGPEGVGATHLIPLGGSTKFGFYLNPNGTGGATNAPEPELFFSNRTYNDQGPNGSGAIHSPTGGDVQAVIFDVSSFSAPNTWLVCFEDLDSGANPAPCCSPTDNDFNDLVFEVTALGVVPATASTMGRLKAMYR